VPKPYFLTRQTANLMEDFVRDLKSGSGVYLLYGDEGVGKTRLLEELAQSRLQDVEVRWIDLKAGGSGEGALIDSSALIEDTFATANTGDVIIADHFEMALKKTRHQLFLSWSTDGADKRINLIVAGNTSYYNELRQLAQQYQLRAQSFQLMPFGADEAEAFLGFYLFQDKPVGKLSVPPLFRNQFSMSQGNVGKFVEIAERAGNQISSEPLKETEPARKVSRAVVGVLIAGAVIVAAGWYFFDSSKQMFDSTTQIDEMPVIELGPSVIVREQVQASQPPAPLDDNQVPTAAERLVDGTADEVDDNKGESVAALQSAEQDDVSEKLAGEELVQIEASGSDTASQNEAHVQDATASVDELRSTATAEDELQATEVQDEIVNDDTAPASASQSESVPSQDATSAVLPSMQSQPSRLLQDLQASLEWINSRDSRVGTMQIMLLRQNRFEDRVYYKYLDRLSEQGIDISEVRIFETHTGNQKMFSVVYGEYQSRGAANAAKTDLPLILQDAAPIGRSVGGLMEEIQRLEGKN
jgi:septal ring-binding cell division protein DamX